MQIQSVPHSESTPEVGLGLQRIMDVITERDNPDLVILKSLYLDHGDQIQRCFEKLEQK